MTTIKDIAKMAGVSHGTVSNVLNGRGNVSVQKIKLVEEVALKLGYQLNVQAKILKEGFAKTISIILPNIITEQFSYLYNKLFIELNELGYETAVYLTYNTPELELQFIQKIATKRDSAIIVVSCLDSAEVYYQNLAIAKDKIIFVYNRPKLAEKFISLDFKKAGENIAKAIMDKDLHKIGLLIDTEKNTYAQVFKQGLLTVFKHAKYDINLDYQLTSNNIGYNEAFDFFSNPDKKFDAIITSGIEKVHYIKNACYFGSQRACPPIYTLCDNCFKYHNDFYQYQMHYGLLSQRIVNMIEGNKIAHSTHNDFQLLSRQNYKKNLEEETLNVLVLPSPATNILKKLLPHFYKMTGVSVNLIIKPFDEIHKILDNLENNSDIDVMRVDISCFPWFAQSAFKPLTDLNLNLEQFLSQYSSYIIERFTYVNGIPYAIPFDPSIQMLFYRKDIFNDPLVKRYYFEKYRQQLDVPTNFNQFNQLSEFFNQYFNPESSIEFGSCITLGNPKILASEFLLRYYAHGGKLVQGTNIELNKTLAVVTLREFEQFIHLAKNLDADWWSESIKQFEHGNIAMLIVYMNLVYGVFKHDILPLIGCAAVPGNKPLLGGGSLCMSKYSLKNNAVSAFFSWLYSPEINEQIALLNGSSVTDNVTINQQVINNYPWLNVSKDNYVNSVRENTIDNDVYLDLPRIEKIIGHHLLLWTQQQYSVEETINNLNIELALKAKQLLN